MEEKYHSDSFGKPYDAVLGHYNYGFRDYDPMTGRFATVDPIRDGRNWYVYTANDPVNFIDFWELAAEDAALAQNQSTKKFFVGYDHIVIDPLGTGRYHTLIRMKNTESGKEKTLVEGFPQDRIDRSDDNIPGWGSLKRTTESDLQTPGEEIDIRDPLPVPKGMSGDEFEASINEAADRYNNSVPYKALPARGDGSGNSNSLVGSVLRAAGSDYKPIRKVPGWNKEVLPALPSKKKLVE